MFPTERRPSRVLKTLTTLPRGVKAPVAAAVAAAEASESSEHQKDTGKLELEFAFALGYWNK